MNKYKNIIKFLNLFCPTNLAFLDDFVGEQIKSDENKEIKKILISLDCTNKIIEKAINEKIDLIITHHSFFYPNLETALLNQEKKEKYNLLKKHNIAIFTLHTNHEKLYLKHSIIDKFEISKKINFKNDICIKGKLKKSQKLKIFFKEIKKIFKIKNLEYFGDENKIINTILISPGSGGSNLKTCYENNIDLLITGEMKWNNWLKAQDYDQCVVTVGHQMEEESTNHIYNILNKYSVENKLKIYIEKYFFGPIKKNNND